MEKNILHLEYEYYLENKKELIKKYYNKFIVIKGKQVVGSYKTIDEAIVESMKKYELGTFLVKHCVSDNNDNQTFHSRVAFGNEQIICN